MELRQLRFFVILAEELHFRRAAALAHIAQPAFSEQIRRLELELGVKLFERTSHYVRLTEPGRLFREEVLKALEQVDHAATVAAQAGRGEVGSVRVGFSGSAANELTPKILRTFGERFPAVTVSLHSFGLADPTAGLASTDVDIAFVRPPVDGQDALELVSLATEKRMAILPEDHRLAREPYLLIEQLLHESWVAGPRSARVARDFWLAVEHRGGVAPRIAAEVTTLDELLASVAAGIGVALVPEAAARFHARPGLVFIVVPDVSPSTVAIAYRCGETGPLVHEFVAVASGVARAEARRPARAALTPLAIA
ncbi:MAG TPA: LysR substrate-binding domain-containing protein [Thermoleophilaceae bacterium]|jgi:DNA-binding transcriptional LysR family regulator|nr:LysR substrate-binding domain-containing protein [Thermoleophilaceae bacterium]